MDLGAGVRGVDMGPSAVRYAGLVERLGALFSACGWPDRPIAPERIALVGLRDLDPGERDLIRALGLTVYTIADVDRLGVHAVVSAALERLAAPPNSLYVSVDLDVVDP